jgi:hypothetical protein
MHHALRHFIDGAIAARRQNQVSSVADMSARNRAGRSRAGGGGNGDVVPVLREYFYDTLDARAAAPSEFPRTGIVDQDGLPVGCDGTISGSWLNYS